MIAVLMSTYNGSVYLDCQLDSLVKQTYSDFKVYIHDDGSIDDTLDKLNTYCKDYPNKFVLFKNDPKHLGAYGSFMWLLESVQSDYYMFCDQDDYWLPNKVELSIECIKELESKHPAMPIVVHTDLIVVDENLNELVPSYWKYRNFKIRYSEKFEYLPFGNIITGCTMILNNSAKRISLPASQNAGMHDFWIGVMTAKYGLIFSLDKPTIKYRKHGRNVTGFGQNEKFCFTQLLHGITWYRENKPFFLEIGYGNIFKVIFNRIVYFIIRHYC